MSRGTTATVRTGCWPLAVLPLAALALAVPALAALAIALTSPAAAFSLFPDPPYPDPPGMEAPPLKRRVGFGGEGTPRYASGYGSFTRALSGEIFGTNLGGDLRGTTSFVRLGAGGGRYRYRLDLGPEGRVRGDNAFSEAIIGQQWVVGPLFASLAVGSGTETHVLSRDDAGNLVNGRRSGLKLEASAHLRLDDAWAAEAFAGHLWGHDSWSGRVAVTRALPELGLKDVRLGLETGGVGNRGSSEVRGGATAAWTFARDSGLRVSLGAAMASAGRSGPYAALSGYVGF